MFAVVQICSKKFIFKSIILARYFLDCDFVDSYRKEWGEISLYLLMVERATISKATSFAYSTKHVGHSETQQFIIKGVPDILGKDKYLSHLRCNF